MHTVSQRTVLMEETISKQEDDYRDYIDSLHWSFVAIPFTPFMSFSPNMQSVNTFPQCLHFLNRQAIPPNKIMDCFCSIYEC